ncbi:MAG: hypothetical protein IKI39_08555 [Oscillospiraceae bacterium]|nr:hypothetical protein [Oscillospiraceae bacterium]
MGKTERLFYHALAALVFAAACAWCLAALYKQLDAVPPPEPVPEASAAPAPRRFRGLLIRQEQRLPAGAFPGTEAGTRLNAADTGTESALFFPNCDGWEGLSPADAQMLTPGGLERLMNAEPPEREDAPRLVYGFALTCAALLEDGASPLPGPCRLTIDGMEDGIGAELISVTADAMGRRMLLLRLTAFPEALYEMRAVEGTIEE